MNSEAARKSRASDVGLDHRALDKREYLMNIDSNFSYFSLKLYVVTPHLNRLVKTVQMRGNKICFISS